LASWIEHSRKPYEAQHRLVGLDDAEVLELAASFRLCGFWRFNIDSGHFFGTPELAELFRMEYCAGPMDLVRLSSSIHPDDLSLMMETFERASSARLTYHNLYRVKIDAENYKFVRSVGRFRVNAAGEEELVGMTYDLFPQQSTIGFISEEALLGIDTPNASIDRAPNGLPPDLT
jgi:hypothetical protein